MTPMGTRWSWLAVGLVLAAAAQAPARAAANPPTQPITGAQIEADWLRQDELRRSSAPIQPIKPEQDAAGGVDGVIDGKWGFHTQHEDQPWWQVDLGRPRPIGRVVLYNRCDECAGRNARIIVLLSTDGKRFEPAYQHNGTVFYGKTDGKPMVAELPGTKARYVRLQLPGRNYFHLDEVQLFEPGQEENIALGRPATQSSTSRWSARHGGTAADTPRTYPLEEVVERGVKLAESLSRLGADVQSELDALQAAARQLHTLPEQATDQSRRELYFRARWAVRRMALKNPLLDFDTVLFVRRAPPAFPHMSDQFYGWWSRPGGGIYRLEGFKTREPRPRCLTADWPEGSFQGPDISWDGRKVLFAWCRFHAQVHGMKKSDKSALPEDVFYHIFEMNLDGSGVRQLTRGRYDDFDARYLPDGSIVFLSTRKGRGLQVSAQSGAATCRADLPDSYVRCGGDDRRPVPVFTLHRMDADGANLRPISAFENFEWTPSVAWDGRILYARWDYIDRFNGPYMSLWSTNPDGTGAQLVYGNYTERPQCVFEARAVPGSSRLVFTAAAHHSNTGGSLVLLDRARGNEFERPLVRLTPEVCFPETEGWPRHYYANPYPLSENFYLVAWSNQPLPPHRFVTDQQNPLAATGIYLYDRFGNLELLYRDNQLSSVSPLPVRPRRKPAALPERTEPEGPAWGTMLVQDVYRGLEAVERGSIRRLRIVGVPPKTQPHMNRPSIGVSREDPGKFVLGTVPVEADGSAAFRLPSGIPVFFQALDDQGLAVQTMRSLIYVQPGETVGCIGCHEHRDLAPPTGGLPLAALREPSALQPGPKGSWPLRFDRLVQPVLDRHCAGCHRPDGDDPAAARFDLTSARAYQSLLGYANKDLERLAFEKPRSIPGDCPARKSKLLELLTAGEGHHGVSLDPASRERLVTWMDVYAQRQGHFSDQQEAELVRLREQLAELFEPPSKPPAQRPTPSTPH